MRKKHRPHGKKLVREFEKPKKKTPRAGFIPGFYEDEVEVWQVWLHSADGEESKRATYGDLEDAGFKLKK